MKKTYYYIYETTNLVNDKTYIGQHITKNLDDGYIGSGKALISAIKKYGKKSFKKEILMFVVNLAALNFVEKCLVTEEYINQKSNYNLRGGGGSKGSYSIELKEKFSRLFTGRSVTWGDKISKANMGRSVSEKSKEKFLKMVKSKDFLVSRAKNIPPIINLSTGEFVEGEKDIKKFCKNRNIQISQFRRMLYGKLKSKNVLGWTLF